MSEHTRSSEFANPNKLIVKFIMIGNAAVGKTSLMTRYFDAGWTDNNISTLTVSQKNKTIELHGKPVKL